MPEPRFGEHFEMDPTDRLELHTNPEELPECVRFTMGIREELRESIKEEGWPEMPQNFEGFEDFFAQSKDMVAERWQKTVGETLSTKLEEWRAAIPKTKRNAPIIALLSDPESFESKLNDKQLGTLEPLRESHPEIWRSIVMLSSERQLSHIALLHHWFLEMPDDYFAKLGFSRNELGVLLLLAGTQGKHFDQAHLRQIEYADQPGGTSETVLDNADGAEYVYDLYVPGREEISPKAYNEVFPSEWRRIVPNFAAVAERVSILINQGGLSANYAELPEYLRLLAWVYGSGEKDPEELDETWQEIGRKQTTLIQSGCPIVPIYMASAGVTGDAGKVDVELRLGLITPQNREDMQAADEYRSVAETINDKYADRLKRPAPVSPVVLTSQPFSFGPNLYSETMAETSDVPGETIMIHTSALTDGSLFPALFPSEIVPDRQVHNGAVIRETCLHELGHQAVPWHDPQVKKRIGKGKLADTLDEIKADVTGMLILETRLGDKELPSMDEEEIKAQFVAKLCTIIDYLSTKSLDSQSGRGYFLAGLLQLKTLLDAGIIRRTGVGYEIVDHQKGIEILANVGESILQKFYLADEARPGEIKKEVKEYLEKLASISDEPQIQEFLEQIARSRQSHLAA